MWTAAAPGLQTFTKTLSSSVADQTIEALFESVGWNGTTAAIFRLRLTSSMDLYSTTTATAALSVGTIDAAIIARSLLYIDVEDGSGFRGAGGDGGDALSVNPSEAGGDGGDAIDLGGFRAIINLYATGLIFGGGGGGGGGGKGTLNRGGGGGAGAGRNQGAVGLGIGGGANGGTSTTTTGGGGGANGGSSSGDGGDGGGPGEAGDAGQNGSSGNGGAGGAAGKAIDLGGGSVTWVQGTPGASQLKGAVS